MVAHAVDTSVKTTLKNHVIKFNKGLYMQVQSAAFSVSVVRGISSLFMASLMG